MDHIGAESAVCTNCTVRKITFTPTRITNYYYPNTNTHWTPSVLVPFWVTVEVAMVIDFGVCSWQSEHGYVLYWWFPSQRSNLWVKRITDGSDRFFRTRESDTAHSGSQIDVPAYWPTAYIAAQSADERITRWHIVSVNWCVHTPHAIYENACKLSYRRHSTIIRAV